MSAMPRAAWLDAVLDLIGVPADKLVGPDRAFLTMTRKQLVAVEFALVAMRDNRCNVGCGDCDWCEAQNAKAKEEYDRKNPVVGKHIQLLPMTMESRRWVAANKAKRCKMLKRSGERFTVRASNGRRKTFGPHDATWTVQQANARKER